MKIGTVYHRPQKPAGLGDRMEKVAKPIAIAFDRVTGADLANCKECEERREWLNDRGEKLRQWLAAKLSSKKEPQP